MPYSYKIVLEGNIIRPPDFNLETDLKLSAGTIFYMEMQKHGDKIAQYIAETGETDTFSALLQRSIRAALKMKDMGLSKGDIISICSHNHLNNSATFIAATFLGVINASLDPSLTVQDTAHLVQQTNPKIIFACPEAIDLVEKSLKFAENDSARIVIYGERHHALHQSFEEFLQPHKEEQNFRPNPSVSLEDTMIILFSSGTTGIPKGICLSGYSCICSTNQARYLTEYDGSILLYSTLYWISSCLNLWVSLMYGVPRVLCRNFDKAEFWKYVLQYNVCYTLISPFLASEISKTELPPIADMSKLHYILITGEVASQDVVMKLRKVLPNTMVAQSYGQSEVGSIAAFAYKDKELSDKKPKSSGRPVSGTLYKIVDPVTEETLRPDQRGELYLKSKKQFNGYHNRDSSGAFDKDGWVKTGDIVYFDEDFCIYVVDRIKEVLKYRSIHVIPTVLEDVLVKHPAVKSAAVIGIPHEIDGDHPMAIVVLKDGHANICSEEIEEFVAGNVHETQKLRAGVKFVKEIPLTPTYKFNRRILRDMVLSGKI